ncbi:uncharacterized protein LOC130721156 [Lotus japonicus]|uniref:uncharacterized protein LOC130721156 n=1 Tax=Lotus japonicus TaxID=34305 RepID=UPI00258681CA|nr:uncharacterized protein LOC130721156 [Lotus japonicus]
MIHCHRVRALLSQLSSKCSHSLQPISHKIFFSTTSEQSFTTSYLTQHCGFTPQSALKASKRVRFDTAKKPESVIAFFQQHGFSPSQIQSILIRAPELLTCDPIKRVLPKFQFLASKGASTHDIVTTVTRSPGFLRTSLEKHIIPAYELVRRFCPSDAKAISCVIVCPNSIGDARVQHNVKLLLDVGVSHSNITHLIRTRPSILCSTNFIDAVEEVKGLGFDPLKLNFSVALLAKRAISKSQWDDKINALKKWGLSEDEIFQSFKRQPSFMLRSKEKLNAVMSFWVSQLGWDSSTLLASPIIFGFSLETRIVPRASVVQYLLSKGLMKKGASLVTPFCLTDKLFLQKFVTCFEKGETSRLLKLYQGGS